MLYSNQGIKKYDETLDELIEKGMGSSTKLEHGRENYDFENIDFSGQDISNKVFNKVYFDRCNFRGANLSGTIFKNGHMRDSDFSNAILEGAQIIDCNVRDSRFDNVRAKGMVMINCMAKHMSMINADLRAVDFTGTNMRKTNLRSANCWASKGWDTVRFNMVDWRSTMLSKTDLPTWMWENVEQYKLMDADTPCISWKLTLSDGRGIYKPLIKYEVGETYEASRGGESPLDATTNPGIALANLTWVLKEWISLGANPNWKLFMVEFKAGDVVGSGSGEKWTVSKFKIIKEVSLEPYHKEIID